MLKSWWNTLKSNSGFSLVEALVTIAIVGAAMIPISFVFTQTIGTTIETRKQLVANGLGQEYLEALKAKEFSDYDSIFGVGSTIEIDNSYTEVTYDLMGLTPLPEGYKAILSYDTSVDIGAFALPSPTSMPAADIIIDMPSGYMQTVLLTDTDSGNLTTYPQTSTSSTERVIRINGDRDTGMITLDYYDQLTGGGGSLDSRFSVSATSDPAIRLLMGDGAGVGTPITTRIDIDSNLPQEIKLYFYEEDTNTVQATTRIISGSVSISRNLNIVDSFDRRIMAIKVEIFDVHSGNKLGTYTTTKIDE
ncbi:MAG: hypothetical protein CVV00_07365 [Firmicutes bacterium HGW-Firmicutes-5]|nr:MAG: hypothetical protein CVV00_07365 [Firmicutes bacterium HGW-Firmicutes-5]